MVSFRFSNREISHDFNAHVKLSDNQINTLYRHCKQLVEFYNSCPGMCEGEQMETFFRLFTLKALVICHRPMPLRREKVGDAHWKIRLPKGDLGVVQALFSPEDTI